ncbi:flagellar motor switch protein FliN [Candidatus Berkiella aquae]|uniref:Flagellar motor switch protein FliN n=1 Tax=Candidatus Berkiella aquae TaxID=295108 RepID=A0A0Q9YLC2_9GAMM|nr:flagellar motor switch protein FliN [Candidatus Berkiella aquae]MCS5711415.1 flagellar motor switch protein FliN [Candidatus Berkiella aquae]
MEPTDQNQGAPQPAAQDAATKAAAAQFSEFSKDGKRNDSTNNKDLDLILDIPVTISLEVGRTSISIKNLLQLNQGSVVELDRSAGEPLDVLVNGTLIAHAEVVVVNEKFGIRLTDVVSATERLENIQ